MTQALEARTIEDGSKEGPWQPYGNSIWLLRFPGDAGIRPRVVRLRRRGRRVDALRYACRQPQRSASTQGRVADHHHVLLGYRPPALLAGLSPAGHRRQVWHGGTVCAPRLRIGEVEAGSRIDHPLRWRRRPRDHDRYGDHPSNGGWLLDGVLDRVRRRLRPSAGSSSNTGRCGKRAIPQ